MNAFGAQDTRAAIREVKTTAETEKTPFVAVEDSAANKPGEAAEGEEVDDENLDDDAFVDESEDADAAEIIGADDEIEKGT